MIDTLLLLTDTPEFSNDCAEEIRLFLPEVQIIPDGEADMTITVRSDFGSIWSATAVADGEMHGSYTFEYPPVEGDDIVLKRHRKRCVKTAVYRLFRDLIRDSFVPWGSLTGIRPTRLLRDLEDEMGEDGARSAFTELFGAEQRKYDLTHEILCVQEPHISSVRADDIDIYIGIPYCKTRCLYCSFPSGVRTCKTDMRPYIDALCDDIRRGAEIVKREGYHIRASYMGGGTPTVLTEDELDEILSCALESYGTFGSEFTVEAGRPDTITRGKLEVLKRFGAGRISINPQTMNDKTLQLIGRSHTAQELTDCYFMSRDMGFCINTDIITCLPGEDMNDLMHTLSCIEDMRPDNLTVHTLALKRSSKLREMIGDEDIRNLMPTAETADKMVEHGKNFAHSLGMNAYYMYRQKYMRGNLENVGYSTPGRECIYNIDMMEETVSIMAHGAGSMSKRIFPGRTLRVERIPNPKDIATYESKLDTVYADKAKLFERE